MCEHLCTELLEGAWRHACLWKVAKAGVGVGAIYEEQWYSGGSRRDDGGCGKMKYVQKLIESNTCQMACLWIERKSSLGRALLHRRGAS
jgi:hypothetical protein